MNKVVFPFRYMARLVALETDLFIKRYVDAFPICFWNVD